MKFILVPLLIIGMFATLLAGLVGMLLITGRVQDISEVTDWIQGKDNGPSVVEDNFTAEDQLKVIFQTANDLVDSLEVKSKQLDVLEESVLDKEKDVLNRENALIQNEKKLGLVADSLMRQREEESIKELAKFYTKMKPAVAADILIQEGGLGDTSVARLMKNLPPGHMGKIMGAMNPKKAAVITKMMKEVD